MDKIKFLRGGVIPLISAFLITFLAALSFFYYKAEKERVLNSKYNELALDCRIKEKIIKRWQNQQITNAELYSFNPLLASTVEIYLENHSENLKQSLVKSFKLAQELKGYDDLLLVSTSGEVEIALNHETNQLDVSVLKQLGKVLSLKKAVFGEIFQSQVREDHLYLDVMSPVLNNSNKVIAVIIVRYQPLKELLPKLGFDSTLEPQVTSVIFCKNQNKLYHLEDSFLTPLNMNNPIASAVQNNLERYVGNNDDHKKVIAYIKPVEKTDWYVVSQISYEDVLKTYYIYAKKILIGNALAVLFLLLLIVFIFESRQKSIFRNLLFSQRAYLNEQEKFNTTLYSIGEGVITTDEKGLVKNMNNIAILLTGWSEQEAIGRSLKEVFFIIHEDTRYEVENYLEKILNEGIISSLDNHSLLISRNGNEYPVSNTGAPIRNKEGLIIGAVLVFRDQTSERAAEKALRLNEKRLIRAEQIANIGHWQFHLSSNTVYMSESMKNIFGSDSAIVKRPQLSEFIVSNNTDAVQKAMKDLITESKPYDVEFRIKRPSDGKILDIRSIAEYDPKEKVVFGVIRDNTELKNRIRLFKQFFYDGPVVKLLVDPEDGRIIDANKAAASFYGYAPDQLLKMNISDINIMPFEVLRERLKLAITGEQSTFFFQHKLSRGEIRDVKVYSGSVMLDNKNLIFSIIHDITDNKKAVKALRESEERFRQTFFTIPDSVSINRVSDGTYIDVNEGFTNITGFSKKDVIGRRPQDLNIWVDLNDREALYKSLLKEGYYTNLETTLRRKDGSIISVLTSSRIILLNEVPHVISIMHDITHRKNMEEELLKAKEKAEESDHMKTSFLHNISHEIRTPMNGIVGFAELLKDKKISAQEKENFVEVINSSAKQLLSIVDDVLEVSRIESGSVPLHMVTFDLNDLIREIYLFFHPKIKIGFDYSCEVMYKKFFIEGDKEKIRQIISCLISNAIKFTPVGKISFGYTLQDSHIRFFVKDTGIGIPAEEHDKIFRRFYQAKNEMSLKVGGSGLGLNITKGLVELMKGKIWIESEHGKGSTFFFTIPLKNSKIIVNNEQGDSIDFSGKKILIAEDEPTNFQFLRIILSIKGADIEWAKNGSEAIQMVQNHKPDVVLMDLKMPVMDGLESSRQIRKMYPDLPIIAQTAYSLPEEKELAEKAGCNGFVSKPIKANDLFEMLQEALYE